MPTFPENPDDVPQALKPWRNPAPPQPKPIKWDNVRPIRDPRTIRSMLAMTFQVDPKDAQIK